MIRASCIEAMRRFDFDTVLIALNVADVHRLSFAHTVLVEAGRRGMGVIGMKVYAAGALLRGSGSLAVSSAEAMGYVLSLPGVSTVIIGCSSPAEVDDNARNARSFQPFAEPAMRALEAAYPRSCRLLILRTKDRHERAAKRTDIEIMNGNRRRSVVSESNTSPTSLVPRAQ